MQKTMWLAVAGMIAMVGVPGAQAQVVQWEDQAFASVNIGGQAQSHQFDSTLAFELYGETGTVTANHDNGGGVLFDFSGGVRVWRNVGVGVGYSRFANTDDVPFQASVPHPVFFDQHRNVTSAAAGLEHSESAIHIFGLWMFPMSEKTDLAVTFGPTIFKVKQDLVVGMDIPQPEAPPYTPVVTARTGRASATAVGIHLGVDYTYMLTPQFGAGGFVRYSGATADVEVGGQTASVGVGGFQLGAGLRVRFKQF
jgi:hypothetical protein